ncbi:hypothetical protein [Candidatus Gromoviella agglomerans]|uniref:hypothetical protein n=1 Tax=Candidatus Gromoviella agglomerans TaxID=2806609 RepID=UPI001E63BA5D|nr:hypothetical protein [Candidatus Gromoviella agglomerans]UFX98418.1 hypothetical protein Gromo_00320 [Candidatus Gromoviella agglomerans]
MYWSGQGVVILLKKTFSNNFIIDVLTDVGVLRGISRKKFEVSSIIRGILERKSEKSIGSWSVFYVDNLHLLAIFEMPLLCYMVQYLCNSISKASCLLSDFQILHRSLLEFLDSAIYFRTAEINFFRNFLYLDLFFIRILHHCDDCRIKELYSHLEKLNLCRGDVVHLIDMLVDLIDCELRTRILLDMRGFLKNKK